MTEYRKIFAQVRTYCLAVLLLGVSLPTMSREYDLFFYARLQNHIDGGWFVDPPRNRIHSLYYYGDEPECEVILANETREELTLHWITDVVTPRFVKTPAEKWEGKFQFRQLSDRPILKSGQQQIALETTTATLRPGDRVTVTFRIITESGEKPPPGDYEIELNCKVVGLAGVKGEWVFQKSLGFEIREPKTLTERVSFLSLKARRYLSEKNYTAAEEAINQALQLYPFHSAGFSILALSRESQGRYEEAIRYYEKAVELLETRQDYLSTKGRSNTSIEHGLMRMKSTIGALQEQIRRQSQKR
jgi:tetratricopeptide (TPR) repeat protein